MRRLVLVVLALALLVGDQTVRPVHAVTYAPGWNLVAGPAGSTFPGATSVYGFPPGAEDYIARTGATPSSRGYGYWAFYPQGGSPNLAEDSSNCRTTITAPAGQWFLAGDPSGTNTARVSGATAIFAYDAVARAYTAVTALAPGQGAWVMPNSGGLITLEVGTCPPAATTAPVTTDLHREG